MRASVTTILKNQTTTSDQSAAFRQQFTTPFRQIPQNPCEINPAVFTTPKKDVTGNDDDASMNRGTTANGHRQPPNTLALLVETKEDGGKIKSKLPITDPFMIAAHLRFTPFRFAPPAVTKRKNLTDRPRPS